MLRFPLLLFFLVGAIGLNGQTVKQSFLNGKLVAEYTWSADGPRGPYTQWYPNGKIQSQGTFDGTHKSGTSYTYYENDTLLQKDEFNSYYNRPGEFSDYHLDETITQYWENGKRKSIKKFKNGKEQFGTTIWYENGNLKSTAEYDKNQTHKIVCEYFVNGQKKSERPFLNEPEQTTWQQDGTYNEWNAKGIKIMECNFKKGKQDSVVRVWSDDGVMLIDSYYKDGLPLAQKVWAPSGELMLDYDTRKPDNEIEEAYFYPDKYSLKQINYVKRYVIDDSLITLHCVKQFSLEGKITTFIVRYNTDAKAMPYQSVAYWYGYQTGCTLPLLDFSNLNQQLKVSGYSGNVLKAEQGYKSFKITAQSNPAYHDNLYSPSFVALDIPDGFNKSKPDKLIDAKVKEIKEKATDSTKIRKEFLITTSDAEKIGAFYKELLPKVYFDSAIVVTHFDTARTGSFTITFPGTKMKCTGNLKDGLLDGKYIFWLDDVVKLDERDYRCGLLHGEVKEWYTNGKLAHVVQYRFNSKFGNETYYYYNGGKRSESEFAGTDKAVKEMSWYESGNIKHITTFYDLPKLKHMELKDEWYDNGMPKTISLFVDSVYEEADLAEDGKVVGIHVRDSKKNCGFEKYYSQGRLIRSINFKNVDFKRYDYAFEKNGVKISGSVVYDETTKAWNLEDNMGKLIIVDRSVLKFREDLPCHCQDFTVHEFFNVPTKDFITEENFRKYQLDFHQPLTNLHSIYGDPHNNFGEYHEGPASLTVGKSYSFYAPMVVYGDFSFALPDTNGIIFSLTPCRSEFAVAGFNTNISFRYGFPKQTEITIDNPKTLSLAFNANFLRESDERGVPLKNTKGEYMGALYLFTSTKITYNAERELDVANPRLDCSGYSEFTGTGITIDFQNFYPDLSRTKNYPSMEAAYNSQTTLYPQRAQLGIPADHINTFRGVYSDWAYVTVPVLLDTLTPFPFIGVDMLIGSNFACGTLKLSVKSLGHDKYTFVNAQEQTITFTQAQLAAGLVKCGWTKNSIVFDPETSQLLVHFYYEK